MKLLCSCENCDTKVLFLKFLRTGLLLKSTRKQGNVAEVTLMEWCCHNWWFALHSLSSSWWSGSYPRRPPRSSTTPLKFPFFEAVINKCSEWIVLSRAVINSCTNKGLGQNIQRAKNYGLLYYLLAFFRHFVT